MLFWPELNILAFQVQVFFVSFSASMKFRPRAFACRFLTCPVIIMICMRHVDGFQH